MSEVLLSVSGLTAGYGAIEVLRGIELEVAAEEIVAVLGSNGRRVARNERLHPLRWRRHRA